MKKEKEIIQYKQFPFTKVLLIVLTFSILALFIAFIIFMKDKQDGDIQQVVLDSIEMENTELEEEAMNCAKESILINEIHHGDNENWIELYNPSLYDINLDGFTLTESINKKSYTMQSTDNIKSKSYYVLSFDEMNGNCVLDVEFDGSDCIALYTPEDKLISSVNIPNINKNESYGRQLDGELTFQYMEASKFGDNSKGEVIVKSYPVFSVPSGFYSEKIKLKMSVQTGYSIFYTLDGSIPTSDSILYDGEIEIGDVSANANEYANRTDISSFKVYTPIQKVDKVTTIRAIAVDENGKYSNIVTATYFIGYDNKIGYEGLPIISLFTDPSNLFDYWDGIYVTGAAYDEALIAGENPLYSANYWKECKVPAYMQYYEPNRMLSYEGNINLSTYNNMLLNLAQKSLKLSDIKLDTNRNSSLYNYTYDYSDEFSVILSNGRYDYVTKVREPFINNIMRNRDITTNNFQPCIIFLDGEYWGVYNIQHEYTERYIGQLYGLDENDIIISKNGVVTNKNQEEQSLYDDLVDFISNTDLSDEANYTALESMIDIQSLIDCYCCMLYTANSDWLNDNIIMWRTKSISTNLYQDGLWRWIISDTDKSLDIDNVSSYKMNTFHLESMRNDIFFSSLIVNDTFRMRFIDSMMDIINTNFNISNVKSKLNELSTKYKVPIITTNKRFLGSYSADDYSESIMEIIDFFSNRLYYFEKYMKEEISIKENLCNIELSINDTDCGELLINSSEIDLSDSGTWNGKYFVNQNITLTVVPFKDKVFKEWSIDGCSTSNLLTDKEIDITILDDNVSIEAIFE